MVDITYVHASQTTKTDLYLSAADSSGGTSSGRNASMRIVRRGVELPVLVVLARAERADIAAAHNDRDVAACTTSSSGNSCEMSIPRPA